MRERLAIARSCSNYSVLGAEAWSDATGVLLMRWLDNDDSLAYRQVKWIMAHALVKRVPTSIVLANKTAHYVLRFLRDQRCPVCKGHKQNSNEFGVYRACLNCNSTGLIGCSPAHWGENHQIVLRSALSCIGRALAKARESWAPDSV